MKLRVGLMLMLLLLLGALAAYWRLQPSPGAPAVLPSPAKGAFTADALAAATPAPVTPESASTAPNTATAPAFASEVPVLNGKPAVLSRPIDDRLDPEAARALFRRVEDGHDCWTARGWGMTDWEWERMTGTHWLAASERERVLSGRKAAAARLMDACRRQGFKTSGDTLFDGPGPPPIWERLSAAASGDLAARIYEAARGHGKPDVDLVVRPLLEEALSSGDPNLVAASAAVVERNGLAQIGSSQAPDPRRSFLAGPQQLDLQAAWTLAACDLGMDCSDTSPTLDRLCLNEGLCGYPNVEAALRDGGIAPYEVAETEARRQWLVGRIRSGTIDGMFDPPPPLAPPSVRRKGASR